jgi:uncharacterized membrane protein YcjF (UPF0283 family)
VIFASSYPFWSVFWTILIVCAWIVYVWIAITVLIDVFRRDDLSGWGKAAWVVAVIVLEWIGVLIYLILNHRGMSERRHKQEHAAQAQFDEYVRATAGASGPASEIETASRLLDSGAIDQAEFDAIKAKALAVAGDAGRTTDAMSGARGPVPAGQVDGGGS